MTSDEVTYWYDEIVCPIAAWNGHEWEATIYWMQRFGYLVEL